jgi:carboxylesterase
MLVLGKCKHAGALQGDGTPDPITVEGSTPALLLLHGLGATPRELDLVADLARDLGLQARGPLLPGHGTHARDLAKRRFVDWYAAAERELFALAGEQRVILIGLSMGSVVAMHLAAHHPSKTLALGLLANASRMYKPYPSWPLAWLSMLPGLDILMPKANGPDIADPDGRRSHLNYGAQPALAANSLRIAGHRALQLLPGVSCPCFIAHGQRDHVAPVSNAWEVANRVGTNDVEVLILPDSNHIITKDVNAAVLRKRLRAFLKRFAATRNEEHGSASQPST